MSRGAVGVCATCLAVDRTLSSLQKTPQYVNICSGLTLSMADNVCYECRATLANFVKFRSRALWAAKVLACVPPRCNLKTSDIFSSSSIKCLSTLGKAVISPQNTIYVDRHLEILKEALDQDFQVKQEYVAVTDEPYCPATDDSLNIEGDRLTEEVATSDVKSRAVVDNDEEKSDPLSEAKSKNHTSEIFSSSSIKCLSTLGKAVISPQNTIYVDGHLDILKEAMDQDVQVKQEYVAVTDEPYCPATDYSLKIEGDRLTEELATSDVKSRAVVDNDKEKSDTLSEDDEAKSKNHKILVRQIDQSEVLAHLERERGSERFKRAPYKCYKCAQPFLLEQKLNIHNTLHSEERGDFKCEICELRYKDSATLKRHTDTHYRSYGCPQCDRTDCNFIKIHNHFKKVHDDTTLRACRKCPARFTTAADLRRHVRDTHDKHICHLCNRQYTCKLSLEHHIVHGHTKVRRLECPYCHKKYKGEANLKVHVRKAHERPKETERREDAYCAECDMQLKDHQTYKTHLKTSKHLLDDDYKHWCDYCGKRYTQKMSLITHIEEQHLKLSRYKCKVCEERFHSKVYVLRHVRIKHSGKPKVNKHVCEICTKAFFLRKSLVDHMNKHLGVRPYECKLCGATFAYSAALYNHNQLVHLKRKVKRKGGPASTKVG